MASKILLVYAGPTYPTWTTYNVQSLATEYGATDFLLLGGYGYNYVTSGGPQIVTNSWIDANITTNGAICGTTSASDIATIKTQMKDGIQSLTNIGSSLANYTKYTTDLVTLAKGICANNPNAKIWFGLLPFAPACHAAAECYVTPYKTGIIDQAKAQMTAAGYWNRVEGFYFGQEDIVQWYTKFNRNNVSTDFDNVVCKCMRAVSEYVHSASINKKMLWIPYYHDTVGNEVATRDGSVINRKNYFDMAILQPSYYFNASMGQSNLDLVKRCAVNNRCEYIGGAIVGGSKTSTTRVGIEIEADIRIGDPNDRQWLTRFEAYANTYGPLRGGAIPFAFYGGGVDDLKSNTVKIRIAGFFSV